MRRSVRRIAGAAGMVAALLGIAAAVWLFVTPAVRAQTVSFPGAMVSCGQASMEFTQLDRSRSPVMMSYVSSCPAGDNLVSGGVYPTAFIADTQGWFHLCSFGTHVTSLRWAKANPSYDPNLPIDPNNPAVLACDPNKSPTVQFSVYSGPDGTTWSKAADLGAVCNAIVDPNNAASACDRQDFTERTYSRYVKLGWAYVADANAAGHDPNCALNSGEAEIWMTCAR